jgi:hypothetical protein
MRSAQVADLTEDAGTGATDLTCSHVHVRLTASSCMGTSHIARIRVGTTTAWRYIKETVALLAARAPGLRRAVRDAKRPAGLTRSWTER